MKMPPELRQLFLRFNQLGALLPRDHDYLDEPNRLADTLLVIAEMQKVDAQTKAYLERYRNCPAPSNPKRN